MEENGHYMLWTLGKNLAAAFCTSWCFGTLFRGVSTQGRLQLSNLDVTKVCVTMASSALSRKGCSKDTSYGWSYAKLDQGGGAAQAFPSNSRECMVRIAHRQHWFCCTLEDRCIHLWLKGPRAMKFWETIVKSKALQHLDYFLTI